MKLLNIHKWLKNLSIAAIGVITLATSIFACSEPDDKILVNSSLNNLFTQLINNNSQTQRILKLGNNLQFNVTLNSTPKGNGTLKIHNLNLRIFDQHDDGLVYEGGLLKIDFKDLNNDKLNEIIITGILKYTGDNESDLARYEAFIQIFNFDCKAGLFVSLYKTGGYSIELPSKNVSPVMCVS